MTEYYTPNAAEFQSGAREHFGYLIRDFAFQVSEAPPPFGGPYSTFFARSRSFVCVEGASYGMGLVVELGSVTLLGSIKDRFSLHTLMRLRDPALLAPRFGDKRGQLEEMRFFAAALRQTATDFLAGNFAALPEVVNLELAITTQAREEFENAQLARTTALASEAFHAGRFAKVIELLQPHVRVLSKAQQAMLRLAMKRMP